MGWQAAMREEEERDRPPSTCKPARIFAEHSLEIVTAGDEISPVFAWRARHRSHRAARALVLSIDPGARGSTRGMECLRGAYRGDSATGNPDTCCGRPSTGSRGLGAFCQ